MFFHSGCSLKTALLLLAIVFVSGFSATAATSAPAVTIVPGFKCDIEFSKLGVSGALSRKTELIAEFLNRKYATVRENWKFIRLAQKSDENSGVIFGDTELSNLGPLNGITKDKSFVTSITNKHKDLTIVMLKELAKKHANDVDLVIYSDFKSMRYAFVPKHPGAKCPPSLTKDLEDGFETVNSQFVSFVKENGFEVAGAAPTETWFRGGIGATADQAGFAARMSRDMGEGNPLRNFNNNRIVKAMDAYRKWAEEKRLEIIAVPGIEKLLDGKFVKAEVLDIVKKSKTVEEARSRLRAKYRIPVVEPKPNEAAAEALSEKAFEAVIERISIYNEIIDNFSPGIFIADRKVASLAEAQFGGFSADFKGMSAKNRDATARALAEGKTLKQALKLARANEQAVTKEFQNSIRGFNRIIKRFVDKSVSSGDDFVGVRSTPWTDETKKQLINQLARLKNPSAQRISFISEGVAIESRNILAAHGEAIEKFLRIELEGKIPYEQLDRVIFAVDMEGKEIGTGGVKLITGEGSKSNLNEMDRMEIETAFQRAVRKFNAVKDDDDILKAYSTN